MRKAFLNETRASDVAQSIKRLAFQKSKMITACNKPIWNMRSQESEQKAIMFYLPSLASTNSVENHSALFEQSCQKLNMSVFAADLLKPV